MDKIDIAALDQASAFMADNYPPMLWRFYVNCRKQGFSDKEGLALTLAMFASIMSMGKQGGG